MAARRKQVLVILGVAVIAGLVAAWALAHGLGASRDSLMYLRYARILRGELPAIDEDGVAIPLTHYPPAFPVMLAALNKAGVGLLSAAGWVNVISYAVLCAVAAWIGGRSGNVRRTLIVVGFVAWQPSVVFVHAWLISEPPFLAMTLLVLALLLHYRETSRPVWCAVGVGLAIGMATLTRYVGLAFLPAVCWVIWRSGRPTRRADLAAAVSAAVGPLIALAIVQRRLGGSVGHRQVGFEPLSMTHVWDVLRAMGVWFAPPGVSEWIAWPAVVIFGGLVVVGAVVTWRRRPAVGSDVRSVAVPLVGSYVGLLLVSVTMVDHGTPLDERILAPAALLVTVWLAADWRMGGRGLDRVALGGVVLLAGVQISGDVQRVNALRRDGLGFNHKVYRQSELVAACGRLPKGTVIYSNFPEPIFLTTGRDARILPSRPATEGPQAVIDQAEIAAANRRMAGGAYVVVFNHRFNPRNPGKPMTIDEIKAAYPLRLVQRAKDGVLLRYRPVPTTVSARRGDDAETHSR